MLHLARLPDGSLALSAEIAAANAISKKFLDAILNELRTAGLVAARKGRGGGYKLARAADTITAGDVLRVLDGPVAPIQCASRSAYQPCADCPDEAACIVRLTMIEVRDAIAAVLDARSIAELARTPELRATA
jgi:Rrf2 family protein